MTFHIWKRVVFQGLEILLSSKYGKCQQAKQDGGQFCRLACGNVGISMGLAVKVHKKTRNMESTLLLSGVTELKRGLCCLNVQNEALMTSVTSYDRRKLLGY